MTDLERLCIDTARLLAVDMVESAKSGHPGLPLGAAHLAHVIYTRHLRHSPADPEWPDRDRFILSAGHGSALLYAMLHLTGYDLPMAEIKRFRQWGSKTAGHPEHGHAPGIETTTGPLGQGFATGVGMAMAERFVAERFNTPDHRIVDHRVYALVSDGDLMEGISSEAASLAGHLSLGKLIYVYDSNRITIEGSTDLAFSEDVAARFAAMGWHVQGVDGYDLPAVDAAIEAAKGDPRPSLIVARTHIGLDSELQDTAKVHGAALGPERTARLKEKLGWPVKDPFHVPPAALAEYRRCVDRGREMVAGWEKSRAAWASADPGAAREFDRQMRGELPPNLASVLPAWAAGSEGLATRQASGKCLEALFPAMPELIGGSADLAESNNTSVKGARDFGLEEGGRIIHFGVREHAMAAIGNGMALHGGARPYLGTFLVFTDYMRGGMRLAAIMKTRVVYVMTHDSIGLGEDGPTHQPIEHLASLRAMPGMTVLRPADANETAEAWGVALEADGPVVMALTRQKLPILSRGPGHVRQGGYVLREATGGEPAVILIGTGSEVSIAVDAASQLEAEGLPTRVVSMPSWELFAAQSREHRDAVLPPSVRCRVAIEAASSFGWERHVGEAGGMVTIDRFGASAPAETIYRELGITPEAVVARVRALRR